MLVGDHQRDQSELREVSYGQCLKQVLGPGIPPWAMAVDAGLPGPLGIKPKGEQTGFPRFWPFPLPPQHCPKASAHPHIQCFDGP